MFAASHIVSIVIQPRKVALLPNEIKKLCTMKGIFCRPRKQRFIFTVKSFSVSPKQNTRVWVCYFSRTKNKICEEKERVIETQLRYWIAMKEREKILTRNCISSRWREELCFFGTIAPRKRCAFLGANSNCAFTNHKPAAWPVKVTQKMRRRTSFHSFFSDKNVFFFSFFGRVRIRMTLVIAFVPFFSFSFSF